MQKLTATAARFFGFTVLGHGHSKRHYTFTRAEALSWAACYPAATIFKRDRLYSIKKMEG